MMKKLTLSLLVASLFTPQVSAIENGTQVAWSATSYPSLTGGNCTGLVVGGKWIMSAAHCGSTPAGMYFGSALQINYEGIVEHPDYNMNTVKDITFSPFLAGNLFAKDIFNANGLAYPPSLDQVFFFADLTQQTVNVGDQLKMFGFGQTNGKLNYAILSVDGLSSAGHSEWISTQTIGQGTMVSGDSGGINVNSQNRIISLNRGSSGSGGDGHGEHLNLHYVDDFIRETVNGWHYASKYNFTGSKTIEVQSLHLNPTSDTAYTSGDLTITGGTCRGKSVINAYEICTYEVTSQGGEGYLHLSDKDELIVNEVVPVYEAPSSGDSGGSMGFWSLLILGFGLARRLSKP